MGLSFHVSETMARMYICDKHYCAQLAPGLRGKSYTEQCLQKAKEMEHTQPVLWARTSEPGPL